MITIALLSVVLIVYRGFGGFRGLFGALETSYPRWLTVPRPGTPGYLAPTGLWVLSMPWFFSASQPPGQPAPFYSPSR